MEDSPRDHDFASEIYRRLKARHAAAPLRVEEQVGEGGMSIVWRARDDDLHRDVAKKVLRDDKSSTRRGPSSQSLHVARFLDEAQVTAQLDHPGIVPVHQLGVDDDDGLFFTMKLVRGQTLKEVFELVARQRDGWTVTRAVGVLLKVCEAMSYAHSKKVLHRDLKPSNVMVGRFGEVYVMDWGLARVLGRPDARDIRIRQPAATTQVDTDRHALADSDPGAPLYTMDGDVVGTPAYMSPEQANGLIEQLGPPTDIYSAGAILYHLLAGQMPYVSPATRVDNYAIWRWVREGPPSPLEVLAEGKPPELIAICNKAMERDVARRYASMQELAAELRAWLEGRVVTAHKTGVVVELRKWIARNKTVAALLAALVLALVGGGYGVAASETARANEIARNAEALHARELLRRADELGAIDPAHVATMQAWLDEARALGVLAPQRKRELDELTSAATAGGRARQRTAEPADADVFAWKDATARVESMSALLAKCSPASADMDAEAAADVRRIYPDEIAYWKERAAQLGAVAQPRTVVDFDQADEAQRAERLRNVVEASDALARAVPRIEERVREARSLTQRSFEGADAERAWRQALASIEDREQCPLYEGRSLTRQLGLVPLGQNDAGLWEFWHVLSGDAPARDEHGHFVIGPRTGIVLILMPGGRASIGAQARDEHGANYDPRARPTEVLREVELDWYFIGKYEVTQGQWLRLTGANPSTYASGTRQPIDRRIDRTHPVEHVTWFEAQVALAHVGLDLPTEAQFEHAARGGSTAPFVYGDEPRALLRCANFGDQRWQRLSSQDTQDPALLAMLSDDGFGSHAPVGSFPPNAWQVHDALGNVAEWCRDWYADAGTRCSVRPGTGELMPERSREKALRGGSFKTLAADMRVAARGSQMPDDADDSLGVRAARPVFP